MWLLLAQQTLFEFFWDIFFFPVWWYTRGVAHAARFVLGMLKSGNDILIPGLWLRNLFVPMFGQIDWQGRITSFFIRVINVIIRGILLAVWLVAALALFVLWFAAPIVIAAGLRSL